MFGDSGQDGSSASGTVTPAQPNDGLMGMPGMNSPAMSSTVGAPMMSDDNGSTMLPADEMPVSDQSDQTPPASRDMPAESSDDLMNIKQDALRNLKPLVGHLEQTPEEKFRTTMMMIQASDDQSLIPEAYDAAKAIEDEKTRAQALLDVVNEINYFTQQATK